MYKPGLNYSSNKYKLTKGKQGLNYISNKYKGKTGLTSLIIAEYATVDRYENYVNISASFQM